MIEDVEVVEWPPLLIPQEDAWSKPLTFQLADGSAWDVSDLAFASDVRRDFGGITAQNPVLASFTFDMSEAATGHVVMRMIPSESAKLLEECVGDIKVKRGASGPWTWFRFPVYSRRVVTHVA